MPDAVWRARLIVVVVVAAVVLSVGLVVWRENERRYDNLRITGCFGDSATSALGVTQECTNPRRLCRDVPPLIDWRRFCR